MTEKCPSCNRKFERIEDYPKIFVAKFNRIEIPESVVFPNYNYDIFVGPKSQSANPTPPQEVLDYFRDNTKESTFNYDGWCWRLESRCREPYSNEWKREIGLSERIKNFLNKRRKKAKDWEIGQYSHYQENARENILSHINPYLEKLEELVGKEVSTEEIIPKFRVKTYFSNGIPEAIREREFFSNGIPETMYNLDVEILDGLFEQYRKQEKLEIPTLNGFEKYDKALFEITHHGIGCISEVHTLANVGILAFEGRMNR